MEETRRYWEGRTRSKDERLVARYGYGNHSKSKEYWRENAEKKRRFCGMKGEETRPVLEECERTRTEEDAKMISGSMGWRIEIPGRTERMRR